MKYGNHPAHAIRMDWQLRELVFWKNALAHPPKDCTGVQVANVITWMTARKFPLESYSVGIMGIWVHDPIHVGSRLLSAGDSFREVSGFLLGGHVNGFIYHLIMDNFLCASRRARLNAFP